MYFLAEILLILDYDDGWLTRVKISVHSQIWGEVDIPSLKHVLNFLKFPDCDKKNCDCFSQFGFVGTKALQSSRSERLSGKN